MEWKKKIAPDRRPPSFCALIKRREEKKRNYRRRMRNRERGQTKNHRTSWDRPGASTWAASMKGNPEKWGGEYERSYSHGRFCSKRHDSSVEESSWVSGEIMMLWQMHLTVKGREQLPYFYNVAAAPSLKKLCHHSSFTLGEDWRPSETAIEYRPSPVATVSAVKAASFLPALFNVYTARKSDYIIRWGRAMHESGLPSLILVGFL